MNRKKYCEKSYLMTYANNFINITGREKAKFSFHKDYKLEAKYLELLGLINRHPVFLQFTLTKKGENYV